MSKDPYTPASIRNSDKYRGANVCVQAAMMNPTTPQTSGPTRCQKRSCILSLETDTAMDTMAAKTYGGTVMSRDSILPN